MNDPHNAAHAMGSPDSGSGEPVAVIRRRGDFIFSWVVVVGLSAMLLSVAIWTTHPSSFFYRAQGLLAVWPAVWIAWLVGAHPKLVIRQSGLEITNWFVRYQVPWSAIRSIQTGDVAVIHLVDGGKIKPAVGAFSVSSSSRGKSPARGIGERLEQARGAAAGDQTDTRVSRRLDLHPLPFLGLLIALMLVALIATSIR